MNRRGFLKASAALYAATQAPVVLAGTDLPPYTGWPFPWTGKDIQISAIMWDKSGEFMGVYFGAMNALWANRLIKAKDKARILAWMFPEASKVGHVTLHKGATAPLPWHPKPDDWGGLRFSNPLRIT